MRDALTLCFFSRGQLVETIEGPRDEIVESYERERNARRLNSLRVAVVDSRCRVVAGRWPKRLPPMVPRDEHGAIVHDWRAGLRVGAGVSREVCVSATTREGAIEAATAELGAPPTQMHRYGDPCKPWSDDATERGEASP